MSSEVRSPVGRAEQARAVPKEPFPASIVAVGVIALGLTIFSGFLLFAVMNALHDHPPQVENDGYSYNPGGPNMRAPAGPPVSNEFGPGRTYQATANFLGNDAALLLPCAVWSSRNAFALLDRNGLIVRIERMPGTNTAFHITRRPFGKPGAWLATSPQGLVVAFKDDRDLYFLKEDSLDSLFEIELPWPPDRMVCWDHEDRTYVIAVSADHEALAVADVRQRKIVATYDETLVPGGFGSLLVTAAGNLLLRNGQGQVARIQIETDGRLTLEQLSRWVDARPAGKLECADDKFEFAIDRWQDPLDPRPGVEFFPGIDVVQIKDLSRLHIGGGTPATAAAYDHKGQHFYIGTREGEIMHFNTDASRAPRNPVVWRHTPAFPMEGSQAVRQLAMNSTSDMLLVMLERELIVLSERNAARQKPAQPRPQRR